MPANNVARRVRPQPVLTPGDTAAIEKYGRPRLLKRLRVQITSAWTAAGSLFLVGMPMSMSENYDVSDTGLMMMLVSLPTMMVAAHRHARVTRLLANDPANPQPLPASSTVAAQCAELQDLDILRDRLLEVLTDLDKRYPDVAREIRWADAASLPGLRQQGQALSALTDISVPYDSDAAAAQAEIRSRLRAGVSEYHRLLAESVLLLARSDAQDRETASLSRARDVVVSYSEGLRVADEL